MAAGRRAGGKRHGWTIEEIHAKAREWFRLFHEPPRRSDWDIAYLRKLAEDAMARAEEWLGRIAIYERGDWPSARHASDKCGSWNAVIEGAELPSRKPGQHTRRGVPPSPFLVPLGTAMREVYEAMGHGDGARLVSGLRRVARVANSLARAAEAKGSA